MKKYLIIALCTINAVNSMEHDPRGNIEPYALAKKVERNPREWPAQAYEAGNIQQTKAFLNFIEKNNIQIKDRNLLSVGCGTGKIESILIQDAKSIHGFDASKNMIDFAQNKYGHIKNLSFGRCCAEDFHPGFQKDSTYSFSQKQYDSAYASFSMHWMENKKDAFRNISQALKENGELFAVISTSNNPKPFNLIAVENMFPFLSWFNINFSGLFLSSDEELKTMLSETGFETIKFEEQSFQDIVTETELREGLWPIASSSPLMKIIPEFLEQPLFDYYVNECISQLEKTDDNKFLYKMLVTIIHARKTQKQSGNHEKTYDDGSILDE